MTDYDKLINSGFILSTKEISASNPRCYWLENKSNSSRPVPELDTWIKDHKTLETLFVKAPLKQVTLDLLKEGKGIKDASAITLIIAKYNLIQADTQKVKEVRTALVGTTSLNQNPPQEANKPPPTGQIHAEHLTTGTLLNLVSGTEISSKFGHTGPVKLASVEALIYTGQPKSSSIADFPPCASCQATVSDLFKKLIAKGITVSLFGLVDKYKLT